MSLSTYLSANQITDFEGHSGQIPEQTYTLTELADRMSVRSILEIGFNAGHSADTFLSHSLAHVTSFDLEARDYVHLAKKYIDQKYPTRHTLIGGDSTKTIPTYIKENPHTKFDLIYIDGGHTEEIAYADLMNCFLLAHSNTVVIMDDVDLTSGTQREWSVGPSKVWMDAVNKGVICHSQGHYYCPGRGMYWGYYSM